MLVKRNPSHPLSIQLDHIEEVLRRSSWTSVSEGGRSSGGLVADIKNMQWVCKAAHTLKTHCASSALDLREMCVSLGKQAAEGFPIRTSVCCETPKRSRVCRRHEVLAKLFADHGDYLWIMDVIDELAGTDMEVGEHVIRKELKDLGWVGRSALTKRKSEIIRNTCTRQFQSMTDAWRECMPLLEAEELTLTFPGFRSLVRQQGIEIDVAQSQQRTHRGSYGDRIAAVKAAKEFGDVGIDKDALVEAIVRMGATSEEAGRCITNLLFDGLIYVNSRNGSICSALTRKEMCELVGKSANRGKKWGCQSFSDEPQGPPFFKASPKGKTYYRRDDVADWIATHGSHPLDLAVAGKREACVKGGKLGGRPLFSDAV
jgi:hypothetical protein